MRAVVECEEAQLGEARVAGDGARALVVGDDHALDQLEELPVARHHALRHDQVVDRYRGAVRKDDGGWRCGLRATKDTAQEVDDEPPGAREPLAHHESQRRERRLPDFELPIVLVVIMRVCGGSSS